jgi:hypothetical protein
LKVTALLETRGRQHLGNEMRLETQHSRTPARSAWRRFRPPERSDVASAAWQDWGFRQERPVRLLRRSVKAAAAHSEASAEGQRVRWWLASVNWQLPRYIVAPQGVGRQCAPLAESMVGGVANDLSRKGLRPLESSGDTRGCAHMFRHDGASLASEFGFTLLWFGKHLEGLPWEAERAA